MSTRTRHPRITADTVIKHKIEAGEDSVFFWIDHHPTQGTLLVISYNQLDPKFLFTPEAAAVALAAIERGWNQPTDTFVSGNFTVLMEHSEACGREIRITQNERLCHDMQFFRGDNEVEVFRNALSYLIEDAAQIA